MDRFGLDAILPFEQRVDTVAHLCRLGYAERMVLSQDASCYIDWFPAGLMEQVRPQLALRARRSGTCVPALAERGVSPEQISAMLVDNPRRYFERHTGRRRLSPSRGPVR